jgi:hypothetical protein
LLASRRALQTDAMSDDEPIVMYPFRKRDPLTGKWYRARYRATADEIAQHNGEWVIDGAPELRRALGATSGFRPWQAPANPNQSPMHAQREAPGSLRGLERDLVLAFLRRYAAFCLRRRRFAAAQGAAALWREVASGST